MELHQQLEYFLSVRIGTVDKNRKQIIVGDKIISPLGEVHEVYFDYTFNWYAIRNIETETIEKLTPELARKFVIAIEGTDGSYWTIEHGGSSLDLKNIV